MDQHHKESLVNLENYFKDDPAVIAVVFAGSVARGEERPDSDLDAEVIVTPERLEELRAAGRTAECIFGHSTYEGGYFDIKYYTKDFLRAAADHGSEPARNAFRGARCLFSRDPEIPGLVARIPVFQKSEKADKLLSFYAALRLNTNYFWDMSKEDVFLRARAAADTVFFGLRLLLEDRETLFPCAKSLLSTAEKLGPDGAALAELGRALVLRPEDDAKKAFLDALHGAISYRPPEAHAELLSRFVDDNELWWYSPRPFVAEW